MCVYIYIYILKDKERRMTLCAIFCKLFDKKNEHRSRNSQGYSARGAVSNVA